MSASPTATWMLYGANGYTGELCAVEALARGERPILAGRRADAVEPLARRLGLESRVFGLDGDVATRLDGVGAVLHAAGPFSATSRPMLDGCLARGAHYLDITGELEVFEACHARDAEAAARGVVVMPGVGIDVVPSDCLAKRLAEDLPGAVKLELAVSLGSTPSAGTAKSSVEGAAKGGAVRQDGAIRREPIGCRSLRVRFRDRERWVMSIPWGDVSTAYHSTGIPNIFTYGAYPRGLILAARAARPLFPLLAVPAVRRLADRIIDARAVPAAGERGGQPAQFWGRVTDAAGRSLSGTVETPVGGYPFTARTAVESIRRVLAGGIAPGFRTPSMAFGSGYISEFEGCRLDLTEHPSRL